MTVNQEKSFVIFASGLGTNVQKIIEYFSNKLHIRIKLIVSNNPDAQVLQLAKEHNIASLLINKEDFYITDRLVKHLQNLNIDLIILAGFLWLIPENLIHAFPNKIINIHPALLPKFGGKGMYGKYVHKAVKAAAEKETGITIHYVNNQYDEGSVIFQTSCLIDEEDTPELIAKKVQQLEHQYYSKVIEQILLTL